LKRADKGTPEHIQHKQQTTANNGKQRQTTANNGKITAANENKMNKRKKHEIVNTFIQTQYTYTVLV